MNKKQIPEEHHKRLRYIGALIREYRFLEGWSQGTLSEYTNLSRCTISRVENGENISLLTLLELANTLDIRFADLFGDYD